MNKHFFNDDWKNWIWSNIKNGVSKQRIYNDLVEQGYDVFTIINELRFIPNVFRKQDEIKLNHVIGYLQGAGATRVDVPIPFYIFPNFLTETECKAIIDIQREQNDRSTTGDHKECKIDETRTSFTTYFESIQSESMQNIVQQLKQKILSLMGIPTQYSEKIQGQWYKENGFYHNHYDAYEDYNKFKAQYGNRTWTCMITLNDVEEGGDTYFPTLDKRFTPKAGQALIWYNLDENGLAHPLTLHTGQAVKKGEKFIVTQWFRQSTNYF